MSNIDFYIKFISQQNGHVDETIEEDYKKAAKFAYKKHEGQTRSDGSPYIKHPANVASYIRKFKQSKKIDALVSAAYLHDTVEDTDATYEQIEKMFGKLVSSLVKELTSDKEQIAKVGKQKYLTDKMSKMSSWGLVVKLADRLDNVQDIATAKTPEWRKKYKAETEAILSDLEKNRALSKTHENLIHQIRFKLKEVQ